MPGSDFKIGDVVFNKMFLGDKLVYLNINDSVIIPPSQSFSFREDEYSASLVLALPGYQGYATSVGQPNGWLDTSTNIRGNGVNNSVSPSSIGLYNTASIGYFPNYSGSTFVSGNNGPINPTSSLYSPYMATGSNQAIGSASITVEGWVNFPTNTPSRVLFDRYWPLSLNDSEFRFEIITSALTSSLRVTQTSGSFFGGGVETSFTSSQINVNSGSWYHVAVTKDGDTTRMYWSGSLVREYTNPTYASLNYKPTTLTRIVGAQKTPSSSLVESSVFIQDFKYYNGVAKYTGSSYPLPDSMIITTPL